MWRNFAATSLCRTQKTIPDASNMLARLFWAALHGLVELHLDNKFKPDHDITTLTSEMINTLLAGMVPGEGNPA